MRKCRSPRIPHDTLGAQLDNLDPFSPDELTHVVPLNGDPHHAIE